MQSVTQYCWSKIVMCERRNSKVHVDLKSTHKYRIVLSCPPPHFCTNNHFTISPFHQITNLQFCISISHFNKNIKNFQKIECINQIHTLFRIWFQFYPNENNNVWDCRFSKRWRFTLLSCKLQVVILKTQAQNLNPTIRNSNTTKCLT